MRPTHSFPTTPTGEIDWDALDPEQRSRAIALHLAGDLEPEELPEDVESRVARLEGYFAELVDRLASRGGIVLDGDPTDQPMWIVDRRVASTNPRLRNAIEAGEASSDV